MATQIDNYTTEEQEVYTEEDYNQFLDDSYEGSMGYLPSQILENCDPTAYRCGFADFQEYREVFICDSCGEEHENYDEANDCCEKWECDTCGEIHDSEEEADSCCSDNSDDSEDEE